MMRLMSTLGSGVSAGIRQVRRPGGAASRFAGVNPFNNMKWSALGGAAISGGMELYNQKREGRFDFVRGVKSVAGGGLLGAGIHGAAMYAPALGATAGAFSRGFGRTVTRPSRVGAMLNAAKNVGTP